MDGRTDRQRILRMLRRLDADLIALQEVPRGELSTLTPEGYIAAAGPSLLWPELRSGTALLSRRPLLALRHHEFSMPGRERRGALDVSLDLHGLRLRLIATHLGLRTAERAWQIDRLLTLLDADREADLVLLCGDINEWWSGRGHLGRLHRRLGPHPAPASFPALWPLLALDRIWIWGHRHRIETRVEAVRRWPAPIASDHRPVLAEIEVNDDVDGDVVAHGLACRWRRLPGFG
jgi:endonuclease/exonuclease/phosphatase family metal-dependent hydrolase